MLSFLRGLFKPKIRVFKVLRPFTMEVDGELTMFEPLFSGNVSLLDDNITRRLVRGGYLARTGKTIKAHSSDG